MQDSAREWLIVGGAAVFISAALYLASPSATRTTTSSPEASVPSVAMTAFASSTSVPAAAEPSRTATAPKPAEHAPQPLAAPSSAPIKVAAAPQPAPTLPRSGSVSEGAVVAAAPTASGGGAPSIDAKLPGDPEHGRQVFKKCQ